MIVYGIEKLVVRRLSIKEIFKKTVVFLDLCKNGWRYSLALKTSFLALEVSYLNPEVKLSSCKIDLFIGCQS